MRIGEITYANTHAEFLNKKFGTNYKAWMKCCYNINGTYEVWMIRFNQVRDGWTNKYLGDIITDENLQETRTHWCQMKLPVTLYHKKLVFEVIENIDTPKNRRYVFKGVYEYQKDKSNPYKIRVYKKIAEEFPF